jgi:hypothetical protein
MLRVAFDDEEDDTEGQRNATSPEKLFPSNVAKSEKQATVVHRTGKTREKKNH